MNSLERELETIHLENEGLKKKQVKLDEQLVEVSFKQMAIAMENILIHEWAICWERLAQCWIPIMKKVKI